MSGSTFIAYITRTDLPEHSLHFEAKHRYSEFESLRKLLSRLHPTIVVPPIPGKHSVAAYAAKPSKAKEDPSIIEKRKRMLQSFLNRIAAHPILNEEHVFHRFLEGEATWTEILATSGLGGYLKSKEGAVAGSERGPLKHPGSLVGSNPGSSFPDVLDCWGGPAHSAFFLDSQSLFFFFQRNLDPHFVLAEEYTAKFAAQVGQTLKVHRRIVKDYVDAAACSSDLGAAYNAWSLSETALSSAVEHVGQAIDSTVSATSQLAMSLEERFTDPMNEYAQFSQIIEKLLRWRHAKHVEYETVCESLVSKQSKLTRLESSEAEAQRLSAVLNAEGANGSSSSQHPSSSSPYSSATTTTTSPPTPRPSGLLATFNSFIDNDPDQTRRNAISKTKDQIDSLQSQRDTLHGQLVGANEDIQSDLNRFQVDKEKDLRNMLLGFAMAQRDYCRKCVGAWKEAKGEIEKIQT
ncbi:Sorting nexin, cytoplasm-to-vacuole targeting pathway/endosomal sorting [Borealophlyctis nickersoniae]|nr:Sorting nexin, cytoplasm-to-vacuole targeting pathway/endosomal sorting [Borealophlyctis nickersoniae]